MIKVLNQVKKTLQKAPKRKENRAKAKPLRPMESKQELT